MTDYNKSTVADLRKLLKDRSIPSTGLTRKAQIIEKLEEHDNERNGAVTEPEATPGAPQPEVAQDVQDAPDEAAAATPTLEQTGLDSTNEPSLIELAPPTQDHTSPTPEIAAETKAEHQNMSTESVSQAEEVAPTASEPQPTPTKATSSLAEEIASVASEEQSTPTTAVPAPELVQEPEAETQRQASDTDIEVNTASPDPNEKPSVEKPELLPIPEGSANTTAEVSRMNTEELEADTRKRKRRSRSPELPSQDIRAKKPRPSTDAAPEVHLKEDTDIVMEQRRPEPELETVAENEKVEAANGKDVSDAGSKMEESPAESPAVEPEEPKPFQAAVPEESKPERKEKAPRYKALFEPTAAARPAEDQLIDDRPINPALHPATPAVYIRNFMRPLRPEPLRAHLVSLASPPSSDPDPTILKTLFLDSMKTHALVLFETTIAASRVRASLHGSIWPAEANRKALWVDFVPDERVEEWIKEEEDAMAAEKSARAAGRPIPAKKYEVVYPGDRGDGVRAVFQEVGAGSGGAPLNAPRGPKSQIEQRRDPPPPRRVEPTTDEDTKKDLGQSFQTLDTLFESTTAKPKLYYLPVSDAISNKRLDELDRETSQDWRPEDRVRGRGRGYKDQKVKISFADDNHVVEVGPDHGPWADDNGGGFRGGRGGRGGGGYRGDGYRGGGGYRGGRGWRG